MSEPTHTEPTMAPAEDAPLVPTPSETPAAENVTVSVEPQSVVADEKAAPAVSSEASQDVAEDPKSEAIAEPAATEQPAAAVGVEVAAVAEPAPVETIATETPATEPVKDGPKTPEKTNEVTETKDAAQAEDVTSSGPTWPDLPEGHPLTKFQARLQTVLDAAEYDLIWGIKLSAIEPIPFHTNLILQKFLRANYNNVDEACVQLLDTLKWRKVYNPEAAVDEVFSEERFKGLGYVNKIKTKAGEKVVTWNIYGACKEPKKTFGDLESFLRWRIALMEIGVRSLKLAEATSPIPDFNATNPASALDPYQMIQLHDYQNVSFFRLDSTTKAASKKTIEVMARYYPELLSAKFFVNVPVLMGWVFTAMKAFLSKETLRKFKVITSGKSLVVDLGEEVPKAYGGKGQDLADGAWSPALKPAEVVAPVPEKPEATETAPVTVAVQAPTADEVPPPPPAKDEPAVGTSNAPIPPTKDEPAAAPETTANAAPPAEEIKPMEKTPEIEITDEKIEKLPEVSVPIAETFNEKAEAPDEPAAAPVEAVKA